MTPILKESRKQRISIQAFKKPLRFVAILTFKAIAQRPTASYNAILRPSTPKKKDPLTPRANLVRHDRGIAPPKAIVPPKDA